ncbi:MAG: hypothetical protein Q8P53_04025 [Candidatus Shapirobacteria bacterium]|nr:hypothetical protein [Candidatus Shapirobacteria bacterium]
MEKLGAGDFIRKCADALEDKRRAEGVEGCKYFPTLNQNMLLALNGAMEGVTLPEAGIIMGGLKERLIAVTTSDKQSAVLGMFYTNVNPFSKRNPSIVVGIYPIYNKSIEYKIRPIVEVKTGGSFYPEYFRLRWVDGIWPLGEQITITNESATKLDPYLVSNPKGFDFLLFKKSPFVCGNSYITVLPSDKSGYLPEANICDFAFEENIISRALWLVKAGKAPLLFRQVGFARYINSHCSDSRYIELHAAFTQLRKRKREDDFLSDRF